MLSSVLRPRSLWSHNPIPYGCRLYLPFWSPGFRGTTLKSIDLFRYDVTIDGATKGVDGLTFDGSNDWVDLGDDRFDDLSAGTIIIWFKTTGVGGTLTRLLDCSVDANNRLVFAVSAGKLQLFERETAGVQLQVDSSALSADTWYMGAYTNDSSGNALYVDGVLDAAYTTGNSSSDIFFDNIASGVTAYNLGRGITGGGLNYGVNHIQREVWFFDYGLTAGELLYIFNKTRGGLK